MDEIKLELARNKYKLPYHWIREPLDRESLPYFGYIQIVLDELPSPPAKVLDAGCGDGRVSAEMVRRGYTVTGVDYLDISVFYAKALVPEGKFFVADLRKDLVESSGLRQGGFHAVVMVEVYEHIPHEDCAAVLANIHNVLRPGGILIVSVPSRRLPMSKLHYRHFDRAEFQQELEEAGFQIRKMVHQGRIDQLANILLSDQVDRLLNNEWLQPIFLKRLRRRLYIRYANISDDESECGRFIAIAERY